MELDTAAIAADLSIDARRLLETLARAVRDHVDEHAEQLAGGAWEEHGMGDELRDLHFEVLKRAASDAKREVGAALLALGAKATLAGNGELARDAACPPGRSRTPGHAAPAKARPAPRHAAR